MSEQMANPLTLAQVQADLFIVNTTIQKAQTMTSRAGKFFRGQAGYHLQQAAEKMIKIQIYVSGIPYNNSK